MKYIVLALSFFSLCFSLFFLYESISIQNEWSSFSKEMSHFEKEQSLSKEKYGEFNSSKEELQKSLNETRETLSSLSNLYYDQIPQRERFTYPNDSFIWMDHNQTVYYSLGTETIVVKHNGKTVLERNARGSGHYRYFGRDPGLYEIYTEGSFGKSEVIKYELK